MYSLVHNDDLGNIIGDFHGIPVRGWDAKASAAREVTETRRLIYINRMIDAKAKAAQQATVGDHEYIDAMGIIQPNNALTASL
jgi:hypothetical protein